ncbi:hypothetical protein [Ramlibacter sp. Leaf400]|uniref:hypothetical protein n=1 Tax=Ramlibacter sp. Leaf400 TaxID=1736365 RepID=UPI0006FA13D8|nr:hypothetical protein [Ramlibacter sp. Leaf400]KQT11487.1 hypothetical protein ASG30_06350 [Ramlibacter sp. Leaf400]
MSKRLLALFAFACIAVPSLAQPQKILFVGNSFTYTRPPALNYNTENVVDMNLENSITKPLGNDPALPQPWGGVPGVFKALADQAGLEVDVRHSLRGGATLRGHLLNTNPAGWDLRANIAADRWDVVVLQGNSTEAVNRAGGDFGQFNAYVGLLTRFIQVGDARTYRESQLYPGGSNALRTLPANPNANPTASIYLYQTWARPDLTYPAGSPYAGEPLETMTADLQSAYAQAATTHSGIAGVVPVGQAFMRAVQEGVAFRDPYTPEKKGFDLWWHEDQFHPSGHGAYLSALVMFGAITRIDPASFGASERAARALGIPALHALQLQTVASKQLRESGSVLDRVPCLAAGQAVRGVQQCGR